MAKSQQFSWINHRESFPRPKQPFYQQRFYQKWVVRILTARFFFVYPVKNLAYTIWLFNIAMENGPFIDGLPIKNGDFPWLC